MSRPGHQRLVPRVSYPPTTVDRMPLLIPETGKIPGSRLLISGISKPDDLFVLTVVAGPEVGLPAMLGGHGVRTLTGFFSGIVAGVQTC